MRLSLILALFSWLFFYSCKFSKTEIVDPQIEIIDFEFPGISIRALQVINDSCVWFAGSKGTWGYTSDGGENWYVDTLRIPGAVPELRSIKVTANGNIFLVNIMNPASVYRSINKGNSWQLVYTDTSKIAFFDAVNFWNDETGIILGDAHNNCFHLAVTRDGGKSWKRLICDSIPPALTDENPFAASNTNIALAGNSVWIGTGGKSQSRVIFSTNHGKQWQVAATPIISGEQMTGIYSVDFLDSNTGVIAGGNWDSVSYSCINLALTKNGGQTWKSLPNEGNSGFISCVQWIPEQNGQYLFSLSGRARGGNSLMALFDFKTHEWISFPNEKNYLSIRFASPNIAWVSGNGFIGKMELTY